MTFADGRMLTGKWMEGVLIMDINSVIDCFEIPPTTQASKVDIPDFGPNFQIINKYDNFCGVKTMVCN